MYRPYLQNIEHIPKDGCHICDGSRGGVPGNENIIVWRGADVVICDYCHADHMKFPGFWEEAPFE